MIFTDFIDFISEDTSFHQKMKTDFMQTANLLRIELKLRVEGSNICHCIVYQTFITFK